jgi:hypothetical protein
MYTGVSNINGALAANGKSALIKTGTGTYKFQALGSSAAFTKLSFSIGYLAQ